VVAVTGGWVPVRGKAPEGEKRWADVGSDQIDRRNSRSAVREPAAATAQPLARVQLNCPSTGIFYFTSSDEKRSPRLRVGDVVQRSDSNIYALLRTIKLAVTVIYGLWINGTE
jgi:hypothetical protein